MDLYAEDDSDVESEEVSELFIKLCQHLANNDSDVCANLVNTVFGYMSRMSTTTIYKEDEPALVVQRVRKFLAAQAQPSEKLDKFKSLYDKICELGAAKNPSATLSFLLQLARHPLKSSTMSVPSLESVKSDSESIEALRESLESLASLVSSGSADAVRSDSQVSVVQLYENPHIAMSASSSVIPEVPLSRPGSQASSLSSSVCSGSDNPSISQDHNTYTLPPVPSSEKELIVDLTYSFLGIQTKCFRKEIGDYGFFIEPKFARTIDYPEHVLLDRLLGTSFLHAHLKDFCDTHEGTKGSMLHALIATLRDQLLDYYRTVTTLQTEALKNDEEDLEQITLKRTLYLMRPHHKRLEWLLYIVEACTNKKGGAIISAVHGYLLHGAICVQQIAESILKAVSKPLFIMLSNWLLDGEILDPHDEFFIESKCVEELDRLWHDKYSLRKDMVPSFLSEGQVKKILATGKSINFLKQVCNYEERMPGRDIIRQLFNQPVEVLFSPVDSIEFHTTLHDVYIRTSSRVVELLVSKYDLMEHLAALRKYILLGQGDFISCLIELLAPVLDQPAESIMQFILAAKLDQAIRETNAQYEDSETMKRLKIRFSTHSQFDVGWDVFSLDYLVDGPVGTIFKHTMTIYQALFGALWKAKRIEHVLSNMKKQQFWMAKKFKNVPDLDCVMHHIHLLTSKMVHFLHQTQYFFLFEILECSWADMNARINAAESLDDILSAHSDFLASVKTGVLLDTSSKLILAHLVSAYNFVLSLEIHQKEICEYATREDEYDQILSAQLELEDGFSYGTDEEHYYRARKAEYYLYLKAQKFKLGISVNSFDEIITKFLELLSKSEHESLKSLKMRLSFNDYYPTQ